MKGQTAAKISFVHSLFPPFHAQSSKDMLRSFSRDFLAGEGDITRHLSFLGYNVTIDQKPLDEFDYAVTNMVSDLKDGVRLW